MTIRPRDWKQHSRNERSITVRGRHFFASRCRVYWRVEEVDQAEPNGARSIKVLRLNASTSDLSAVVMKECGL